MRDDFYAALHVRESFTDCLLLVEAAQVCEGKAGILKGLEVGGFVAEPQLLNDFEVGRAPVWRRAQALRGAQVERSEVAAGQVIAEVGGG